MFASEPATATSDVPCEVLTVCRPSQFESVPSTKIALRNYTEPHRCYAMTEAQLLTPTSMLGRSCANATLCNNDQFTAVPLAAMTDRVCDTTTTCTLQQFEFQVATATSNRICSNVTDCAVDTFIAVPTTANSNNVCMKLSVCTSKEFEARHRRPPAIVPSPASAHHTTMGESTR